MRDRVDELLAAAGLVGLALMWIDHSGRRSATGTHVDPPVDLTGMSMVGPGVPAYRGPAGLLGPGKQIPAPPDDGLLDAKSVNERLGIKDDFDELFWMDQLGWGESA